MYYTGIGSRQTPDDICARMTRFAQLMAERGWTCRSGGAQGADTAFESGAAEHVDLMLPWVGFNGRHRGYALSRMSSDIQQRCMEIAEHFHPAWDRCSFGARRLHARNVMQVLGPGLDSPSAFVACWTPQFTLGPDGTVISVSGGTGQAVRIAVSRGIPVYHFGVPEHIRTLATFLRSP